ncbi:hypothetical protein FZEAL_3073 [Fusarium zealandicum]|uniref:Uncharacterized protein n=1 Tax=Fusarium zealandicum TaxID=1053134 RepID=A0A8H4UQ73_9HYPO|nr:hypothetical protein FZEAL_3073 [Fusarium zealandicum]
MTSEKPTTSALPEDPIGSNGLSAPHSLRLPPALPRRKSAAVAEEKGLNLTLRPSHRRPKSAIRATRHKNKVREGIDHVKQALTQICDRFGSQPTPMFDENDLAEYKKVLESREKARELSTSQEAGFEYDEDAATLTSGEIVQWLRGPDHAAGDGNVVEGHSLNKECF